MTTPKKRRRTKATAAVIISRADIRLVERVLSQLDAALVRLGEATQQMEALCGLVAKIAAERVPGKRNGAKTPASPASPAREGAS